jgi:hypothetical protein
MFSIACIDPGMSGTGIAIWSALSWNKKEAKPESVSSFRPQTFISGIKTIDRYLSLKKVGTIYIEQAGYFGGGSVKGQMVAEKQDLIVLVEFIGGIKSVCGMRGMKIISVPVIEWKGTLPKDVVKKRILKILPDAEKYCLTSHSFDAVGIGLSKMGLINAG